MSITLGVAIEEVQSLLNDNGGATFTAALVTTWLKQAVLDITTKSLCYEVADAEAIALTDSVMEYDAPAGCLKVYAAVLNCAGTPTSKQKGLIQAHPRSIAHLTSLPAGEPEYWYEFANRIGVSPLFALDGARNTLGLFYSSVTDDLTLIPDLYQPLAILFAAHKGKLMDRKPGPAAQLYQHYMNSLLFHRQDLYERIPDALDDFTLPDRTQAGRR